jgi:hypothetical protein
LKLIVGEVDGRGLLVGFADGLAVGSVEIVGRVLILGSSVGSLLGAAETLG